MSRVINGSTVTGTIAGESRKRSTHRPDTSRVGRVTPCRRRHRRPSTRPPQQRAPPAVSPRISPEAQFLIALARLSTAAVSHRCGSGASREVLLKTTVKGSGKRYEAACGEEGASMTKRAAIVTQKLASWRGSSRTTQDCHLRLETGFRHPKGPGFPTDRRTVALQAALSRQFSCS
jgi:hypothetical protein